MGHICEFIDHMLHSEPAGAVLVHCEYGVSRSPTIVIAYLMWKRGLKFEDALAMVKEKRKIKPSANFTKQLQIWEQVGYEIWENSETKVPKAPYRRESSHTNGERINWRWTYWASNRKFFATKAFGSMNMITLWCKSEEDTTLNLALPSAKTCSIFTSVASDFFHWLFASCPSWVRLGGRSFYLKFLHLSESFTSDGMAAGSDVIRKIQFVQNYPKFIYRDP